MHRDAIVLAAGAMLSTAALVIADTVSLEATRDNTLYEDSEGESSNGAGDHFFAGRTAAGSFDIRRGLIAFDIASVVPAGSTIDGATLTLYMSRTPTGNRTITLRRALADWGEGTSHASGEEGDGGPPAAGDATWLHTFYPDAFWSNVGGDFESDASATAIVGGNGFYSWSSAGMATDVQAWLDDPASDFGWVLVGVETSTRTVKRFESRQNGVVRRRPRLQVDFTPPDAKGACCIEGEPCVVMASEDCENAGGEYVGDGTTCDPDPCGDPSGACCFADGSCLELLESDCNGAGGAFQGAATVCDPNPCPAPTGACCFADGTCAVMTNHECVAGGGAYEGNSAACTFDLCPVGLEPFVDPLPVPAIAQPVEGESGGAATYEIEMTQFAQVLHRDLPPTTLWGYGGTFPGPTIEAGVGQEVRVRWMNELRDGTGVYRTDHLLPVDTCPHGAEDAPKTVVHLHGAHVPAAFDGYPEFTYLPGSFDEYVYPNIQPPLTMWYHDHALGITRLNVYLGLAGFYLLRDDVESQLGLPSGEFEVPLAIMDRSVNADGSLRYPELWQDHFFGHHVLVNGRIWPFHEVKAGKYRFRLLNGSGSRTYTLALSSGDPIVQIGTDGGLLPHPVALSEVTIAPAERADVVIDFEGHPPGTEIILENSAPAPFPGGGAETVVNVMKFIVTDGTGFTDALPNDLRPVERIPEAEAARQRTFQLAREDDECTGARWTINGLGWTSITERPRLGDTEIWSFINRSGLMHPMHVHLVQFQILDRQDFEVVDDEIAPVGERVPPPEHEAGWKDTVQSPPNQITRVIARFETFLGKFAYHCHILEHEEQEMMRQYEMLPACPADVDRNDVVDVIDLLRVLVGWGPCSVCVEDVDGDGDVGFADLLAVLANWGDCPE